MEKQTWGSQIFSGFFLVLIAMLAILLLVAVVVFFGYDLGVGPWYVPLGAAVVIAAWIVLGNTRQEPTQKRAAYQAWLHEQEISNSPTRLGDQM